MCKIDAFIHASNVVAIDPSSWSGRDSQTKSSVVWLRMTWISSKHVRHNIGMGSGCWHLSRSSTYHARKNAPSNQKHYSLGQNVYIDLGDHAWIVSEQNLTDKTGQTKHNWTHRNSPITVRHEVRACSKPHKGTWPKWTASYIKLVTIKSNDVRAQCWMLLVTGSCKIAL